MKGIILAGGSGTRLYPITRAVSKQLLPIYDKPMIYYPLALLMQAQIVDILLITTEKEKERFEDLLHDGSSLGIKISYAVQDKPRGIAEALVIAEDFLDGDTAALVLGDNIFYGDKLSSLKEEAASFKEGALIFGYQVKDPERYGVMVFDENQRLVDLVEKPSCAPSSYAVTGLYFYDAKAPSLARSLKPSYRNELEITDLNRLYLKEGSLRYHLFERGFAWLDTGTCEALHQASEYVQAIQERQGVKIACLEEIAYQMGYIDLDKLSYLASCHDKTEYGSYLKNLAAKAKTQKNEIMSASLF